MVIRIMYLLICILVAYYFNVVLHEFGHALFGLLTGYRLFGIQVGRRIYIRNVYNGQWNKKVDQPIGYLGRCLMMPKERKDINNYPFVLCYAGGVIINGVIAMSCIPLIELTKDCKVVVIPIVAIFWTALWLALGNGLPLYDEKTGVGTDGHSIYHMLRDADIRRYVWCCRYIEGMEYSGIRLKDIPEKYYLLYEQGDISKIGASDLKYNHIEYLIDCGQYELAARKLDELMAERITRDIFYKQLICERIWIALLMNETDVLKELYNESVKKFIINNMNSDYSVIRILYRYYMLQGDIENLDIIKRKFDELCDIYPSRGRVMMERDWIRRTI